MTGTIIMPLKEYEYMEFMFRFDKVRKEMRFIGDMMAELLNTNEKLFYELSAGDQ